LSGDARFRAAGRALRAASIAALCGSCVPEEPLAPYTPFLVVHAVLDLGAQRQAAHVRWRRPFTGNFDDYWVNDATIVVTGPDGGMFGSSNEPDGRYRIHTGFNLVPGGTYTLRVTLRTGEEVTGETSIPAATPAGVDTVTIPFRSDRDTLRLSWPRAPGAARYLVDIRRDLGSGGLYPSFDYSFFADTSVELAGTARSFEDPIFPSGNPIIVSVSAVDENYYEYYRSRTDPFIGAAPSRLVGAQGVFGSIVPIIVRRYQVD